MNSHWNGIAKLLREQGSCCTDGITIPTGIFILCGMGTMSNQSGLRCNLDCEVQISDQPILLVPAATR